MVAPPNVVSPAWGALFQTPDFHPWRPAQVRGRLPDLDGTFAQNGPGVFEASWGRVAHPFDAGGALRAARFDGGRVEVALRRVVTPDLQGTEQRGDAYKRSSKRPWWRLLPDSARNVANTHVVPWDGGLYALFEHGLPTRIDRDSLDSLGHDDLGVVRERFTAHPRVVPALDTLFGFDIHYGLRSALRVLAWTAGQPARELVRIPLSGTPFMIHDFAATDRHLIFVIPPVRLDEWGLLTRKSPIAGLERWEPARGTEIVVIPLDSPGDYRRFTVDPFWFWHVGNAWEDGDGVVLDMVRYDDYASAAWLQDLFHGPPGYAAPGRHARLRVDPARESLETLWSGRTISEFPNVDPRRWGTRAEVLWSNAFSSDTAAASGPQDALLRVDHAAGTETLIPLDPGCYPSEPILARDRAGAPWVLSMVLDSRAGASWLGIWSEAGALTAQVEMGQALPIAFHGSYISAAG